MNTNQYTQKTLEALQAAQQLAVEYQHNQLEPEHLLHALASQEQGLIPQLLQKLNVDPGSFAAAVAEKLSALPRVSGSGRDPDKVYISQAADKVLSAAARADEVRYLSSLSPAERENAFYILWALKESYVKADGRGLRLLRQFCVDIACQPPAITVGAPGSLFVPDFPDPAYRLGVCVQEEHSEAPALTVLQHLSTP